MEDRQRPRHAETTPSYASAWFAVGSDRVRLLRDGEATFATLLASVAAAKKEVLVEMYWFSDDAAGRRVRDALVEAAGRGVRVRVVYDAFGSRGIAADFWDPLRALRTGDVAPYGPILPWHKRFQLWRILHRDHRKMAVFDGERAIVGGFNVGEEWWAPDGGETWRDDAIEVEGPTAAETRSLFWRTWRRLGGWVPAGVPAIPNEGNGLVWLIANDRRFTSRREIRRTYLQQIRKARQTIDVANAYFLPDPIIRRALVAARRRGVPVRVLIPGKSDVPHVLLAQHAMVRSLLGRGIAVYAYRPGMIHSKTAIIDDFVTVGSYNLDTRSWRMNLECNIAVFDTAFAAAVRRSFEDDLGRAAPLTEHDLARSGRLPRALGWLLFKLHFLL